MNGFAFAFSLKESIVVVFLDFVIAASEYGLDGKRIEDFKYKVSCSLLNETSERKSVNIKLYGRSDVGMVLQCPVCNEGQVLSIITTKEMERLAMEKLISLTRRKP